MTVEIWQDIKGYENKYQVSTLGNIKALPRTQKHFRGWSLPYSAKLLKPTKVTDGYLCVKLYKDGKNKTFRVHRLVAQAFLLNPENRPQVNHIDHVVTNNCIDNLEWVTNSQNQLAQYKFYGGRNGKKKLLSHLQGN